jgi:ribosomal protein S18 acetylase RimI-like enzyme
LVATLFDEYRQLFGYPPNRTAALEFIRSCVAGGEVAVFTACYESRLLEPLGFTVLYPAFASIQMRRSWQMQDLYVVPRARRLGIARGLMENAIKFARQQGAHHITLLARTESEPASSLFLSLGFEPYEYDPGYSRYRLALGEQPG